MMDEVIARYRIGQSVRLKHDKVEVVVTGILARHVQHVEYEVAWFHEGARKTAWVQEGEIAAGPKGRMRIGFGKEE